MKNLIEQR